MKKKIIFFKEAFILFFIQVILCCVIAINYRAISQANYTFTIISAAAIAYISYFLIQRISDEKKRNDKTVNRIAYIGFMLGSVAGDVLGIYFSKLMLGS